MFGVGDDDQTIYGYNGADPAWLIDFAELFPGAGDHPLEVNYRCPAGTVEVVDRLLRHNRRRVSQDDSRRVDRSRWMVDRPSGRSGGGEPRRGASGRSPTVQRPTDIAVLARVNASLAPIQVALASARVPIAGGVGLEFADRTAVRSVLAWLRLRRRRGGDGARPGSLPTTSAKRCAGRRGRSIRGSTTGSTEQRSGRRPPSPGGAAQQGT